MEQQTLSVISNNLEKYKIYSARKEELGLSQLMLSGFAVKLNDEKFYTVRLLMFPNNPYYLVKNKDSLSSFTLYAKSIRNEDGKILKFQNPVGVGILKEDLKSYLEIKFHILPSFLFMTLYPDA